MARATGPSALVPVGWRVLPAVGASLVWSSAILVATALPARVASARGLARQSPPEPIGWVQVGFLLIALIGLMTVAHVLSVAGHGGRDAPGPVRGARWATWLLLVAVVVFCGWLRSHPLSCVLGCGPLLG